MPGGGHGLQFYVVAAKLRDYRKPSESLVATGLLSIPMRNEPIYSPVSRAVEEADLQQARPVQVNDSHCVSFPWPTHLVGRRA